MADKKEKDEAEDVKADTAPTEISGDEESSTDEAGAEKVDTAETGSDKSATATEPEAEAAKSPEQMTEAELRAEMARHFREQKVDDVLVQFLVSLSNLAYIKMGLTEDTQEVKDLAQASLAIDAFKTLLDTVGERIPDQDRQALAGALSSMQLTYVKAES